MPQTKRAVSYSPTTGLWRCWVRLSDEHGKKAGCWYLEHGFGKLDGPAHPIFSDLDEAQDWVAQRFG
jgi:hypothetical protein